jgi:hypothetical protein
MQNKKCREMTVSGQFYPDNPTRLASDFEKYISGAKGIKSYTKAKAIIVPHAGYAYSGATAARTFKSVSENKYKKIVILAPSHYHGFHGISLPEYDTIKTPLGDILVETDSIKMLKSESINYSNAVHTNEHALEVQFPLIKFFFDNTPVVPLVCGRINNLNISKIVPELIKLYDDNTLWIISSDFTHYGDAFGYLPFVKNIEMNIHKLDSGAIGHILQIDPEGFIKYVSTTEATICGAAAISLLLELLKEIKNSGKIINSDIVEYTTSGKLTGDYSHCVSYAGIVFYEEGRK